MARDVKLEVAGVNIRIPDDKGRDYAHLLKIMAELRRGIQVFGDTFVAIRYFDPKGGLGIFVKYTEIDIKGDWFDLESFDAATPEKLRDITIPANLRPNHAEFYFLLSRDLHVVAFSSYAQSKGLSPKAVEKYFRSAFAIPEIVKEFGIVEVDIVQDFDDALRLLSKDEIKEVVITIRRPNSDDVGDDLASVMEERLKEQKAKEYQEALRADGEGAIEPNERTKKLALVAAENGSVRVKSPVNGVLKWEDTSSSPLTEVTKYKGDESEFVTFEQLARKLFSRVKGARDVVQDRDPQERA